MQERKLFEYAVVRIVPRVERGEFINVGVILYCAGERFLESRFQINLERIQALSNDIDLEELRIRLLSFEYICKGMDCGGTIAKLPLASRFRWLTAARSTIVQTSPVHPGLCLDPSITLEKLFQSLVV